MLVALLLVVLVLVLVVLVVSFGVMHDSGAEVASPTGPLAEGLMGMGEDRFA